MPTHNPNLASLCLATSAAALFGAQGAAQAHAERRHRLRPQETIWSVARDFHTTVGAIARANHLRNPNSVPDWTLLTIPETGPRLHLRRREHIMERLRADNVRLRLGPGTRYSGIRLLDVGTHLIVTARKDGWSQVAVEGGKSGWIRSDFLGSRIESARRSSNARHAEERSVHAAEALKRRPHHHLAMRAHSDGARRLARRREEARAKRESMREQRLGERHGHAHSHGRLAYRPSYSGGRHSHSGVSSASGRDRSGPAVVRTALAYRGTPYVYGGEGRHGFDCSGFTSFLFRRDGLNLPHSARAQFRMGHRVSRQGLRPGDLVFFHTVTPGISHVGMYIGGGRFVHASSRRDGGVRVDRLDGGYYSRAFRGARRVANR